MAEQTELRGIGERIGLVVSIWQNIAAMVTDEELNTFEEWLSRQDSIGFVTDPTAYREALYGGWFEEARERLKVVRAVKALKTTAEIRGDTEPETTG